LIKHPDFLPRVEKAWNSSVRGIDGISIVQEKMKKVKPSLKGWGANVRGDSLKRKKELLSELEFLEVLEEDNILFGDQYATKGTIQANLMQIYEEEEAFWFDRSSKIWLLEGDNNTAYFHRIANGRKTKKYYVFSKKR
jgi:hypothetical protein